MASTPAPTTADDVDTSPAEDHSARSDQDTDPAARRRAAQAEAYAAEARAAAAAAQAKVAIAAAARAAAAADVAAQDAERADAAVRAACQAETRAAADDVRRPAPDAADTLLMAATAPHPRRSPEGGHRRAENVPTDVPPPAVDGGGRAARRHAAAAETTVFAAVTGGSDATVVGEAVGDETVAGDATAVVPAASPAASLDPAADTTAPRTRGRRRRPRRAVRPALVAAAAGGVLALAGVLVAGNVVRTSPQPAAVVEATPSQEPVVPVLPSAATDDDATRLEGTDIDPLSDRAVGYLGELRAAGVPTSRGGLAETEAADLVCEEIEDGVDEARIARALPTSLPSINRAQAADLVEIAKENYCT